MRCSPTVCFECLLPAPRVHISKLRPARRGAVLVPLLFASRASGPVTRLLECASLSQHRWIQDRSVSPVGGDLPLSIPSPVEALLPQCMFATARLLASDAKVAPYADVAHSGPCRLIPSAQRRVDRNHGASR